MAVAVNYEVITIDVHQDSPITYTAPEGKVILGWGFGSGYNTVCELSPDGKELTATSHFGTKTLYITVAELG